MFTPCPTTAPLENSFYPSPEKIARLSYEMITKKKNWVPKKLKQKKLKSLKVHFNEKNLLYKSIKNEWQKFHSKKNNKKLSYTNQHLALRRYLTSQNNLLLQM